SYQWDAERSDKPEYFRLTLRDAFVAAYISTDNKTWQQVMVGRTEFFKQCYAGLIYKGDPWDTGICQWLPSSGSALPILTTGGKKPDKQDRYNGPLEVTITCPDKGTAMRYTLDGSEPTAQSQMYRGPIKLTQAGRHEIRIKAFKGGLAQDTVIAVYDLKPANDKP
ncbi:MAG: chitobiase/beta-hexosaminidase C-terminal domain-containing protein, partial [Phycisphaerales bacterium]